MIILRRSDIGFCNKVSYHPKTHHAKHENAIFTPLVTVIITPHLPIIGLVLRPNKQGFNNPV